MSKTWASLHGGCGQMSPRGFCCICASYFCKSSCDGRIRDCCSASGTTVCSAVFRREHSTSVGFVLKQGCVTGTLTVKTCILLWCCNREWWTLQLWAALPGAPASSALWSYVGWKDGLDRAESSWERNPLPGPAQTHQGCSGLEKKINDLSHWLACSCILPYT